MYWSQIFYCLWSMGKARYGIFHFYKKNFENKTINLFNNGEMYRDFTYIDDIVYGIKSALKNNYDYEIFNLGNNKAEKITQMVKIIENKLSIKAKVELKPIQLGDVEKTYADIRKAKLMLDYSPETKFENGIEKFIDWFCSYYK